MARQEANPSFEERDAGSTVKVKVKVFSLPPQE